MFPLIILPKEEYLCLSADNSSLFKLQNKVKLYYALNIYDIELSMQYNIQVSKT